MTAAAWIAVASLVGNVGLLYLLVWALDRAESAEHRAATLDAQLSEALLDYGAQIAQSKRMARLVGRVQ